MAPTGQKADRTNRLAEIREGAGLSQEQLAQKAGRSVFTISRLERGENIPGLFTAQEIASVLGVEVNDIWPELERAS